MGTEGTTTHTAAPIFVVGSPRSGTSILTWCLGQHPNILPTEESDWLGPFASQVGAHHALGSKRGERSQLSALGVERAEFFSEFGDAIDRIILGHRQRLEELNRAVAQRDPLQVSSEFAVSRGESEPKARWVDGTPEYSMHICGLHKLFPHAKFLHIVRDADAVAASMIAFRHPDGRSLVASADEAYAYWLRATRACLLAGDALGADFVYRLRHADLAAQPEAALRNVFDFLGESFAPETMAPLARRINSSFAEDRALPLAPQATTGVIDEARRLSAQLVSAGATTVPSPEALALFEGEFEQRVEHFLTLNAQHKAARQLIEDLRAQAAQQGAQIVDLHKAIDSWAVVVGVSCMIALVLYILGEEAWPPTRAQVAYVLLAAASMGMYVWVRRKALQRRLARLRSKRKTKTADSMR
jgi:hypothetical protein